MTAQSLVRKSGVSVAAQNLDPIVLGDVLARSGFFQDSRDAAQAAVKVMAGAELGFGPVASMTGIYIVKGRVTLSANLMAAAIKSHPRYTYRVTKHSAEECVLDFVEDGQVIGTSSFTMQDAIKAGLAGSENYKKHPRNMLFARALSNGAKWHCPDALGGGLIYTPDELGVEVDGETGEIVNPQALVPAAEPALPPAPEAAPPSLSAADAKALVKMIDEAGWATGKVRSHLIDVGLVDVPENVTGGVLRKLTAEQADVLRSRLNVDIDGKVAAS